jgi:hypothetical protein
MNKELIFQAQALDNVSSDHICVDDEDLSPEDSERRQRAVSAIAKVIKSGKILVAEMNSVRVTTNWSHFVIEIPSKESDFAGRIAPIVCYGQCEYGPSEENYESVISGVKKFAIRISRSIGDDQIEHLRNSFQELKKKSKIRRQRQVSLAGIAAILAILLVYALLNCAEGKQ